MRKEIGNQDPDWCTKHMQGRSQVCMDPVVGPRYHREVL